MKTRAISPVIATIIIIAVTIAIAVAVAGWMMGLWGSYTHVEALKLFNGKLYTNGTLVIDVINQGSAAAQLISASVGTKSCSLSSTNTQINGTGGTVIPAGGFVILKITCDNWAGFPAGSQQSLTLVTANGNEYKATVTVEPS